MLSNTIIIIIGTAITGTLLIDSNILPDYSYITAQNVMTNTSALIARCVTGLGPSGSDDNNALGGWYFNGNRIPNGVCDSSVVQPSGATINNLVGVINLFQCGRFSTTGEGVYTCTLQNSSMMNQSMRLGIYFNGRGESFIYVVCISTKTPQVQKSCNQEKTRLHKKL